MSELILYNDKSKLFECDIKIEGATLKNTKARLVLEFDEGPTVLYSGKINAMGECQIKIPPIKQFESKTGNAILEIIADATMFEPWSSIFEVEQAKRVRVEVKDTPIRKKRTQKLVEVKVKTAEPKYADLLEQYGVKNKKDLLKALKAKRR